PHQPRPKDGLRTFFTVDRKHPMFAPPTLQPSTPADAVNSIFRICYHPTSSEAFSMHILAAIFGILIILSVLLDAFETIVLPRKIQLPFIRPPCLYRHTWIPWVKLSRCIRVNSWRENFLGYFGPFSLILLLVFWAIGLIFGYALLQFGMGEHVQLGTEHITF